MDEETQIDDETQVLGGNIELTGFRAVDKPTVVVVKKIVGNYVKRISSVADKFEKLSVVLKSVHAQDNNQKYELRAKMMDNGKMYNSDIVDKNLFFALDKVLTKLEQNIKR